MSDDAPQGDTMNDYGLPASRDAAVAGIEAWIENNMLTELPYGGAREVVARIVAARVDEALAPVRALEADWRGGYPAERDAAAALRAALPDETP